MINISSDPVGWYVYHLTPLIFPKIQQQITIKMLQILTKNEHPFRQMKILKRIRGFKLAYIWTPKPTSATNCM